MKRYFAFYGDSYYPSGGMEDFLGHFDTMEEAGLKINETHIKNRPDDLDWEWAWFQIWDSKTNSFAINSQN